MRDMLSDHNQIEQRGTEPPEPAKCPGIAPHAAPAIARHYVDPAAEAMSQNHNLSPPIHPLRN